MDSEGEYDLDSQIWLGFDDFNDRDTPMGFTAASSQQNAGPDGDHLIDEGATIVPVNRARSQGQKSASAIREYYRGQLATPHLRPPPYRPKTDYQPIPNFESLGFSEVGSASATPALGFPPFGHAGYRGPSPSNSLISSFQGPNSNSADGLPAHQPTQCDCGKNRTHYPEQVWETVFPCIPQQIYNLIFESGFMKDFLAKDQKLMSLQISDWHPESKGSQLLARSISYIKHLNGSVGPSQTKCELKEEKVHVDFDSYVSTVTTTKTPDVPSGHMFSCKTRTCLMWAGPASTKIIVTTKIEWSGRSFVQSIIERGATVGQRMYYSDLERAMRKYISEHPTEFIPEGAPSRIQAVSDTYAPSFGSLRKSLADESQQRMSRPGVERLEPISDTLADTMRGTRRELRSLPTTDNYETDTSGPNESSASLSASSQRAFAEAFLRNDAHVQRRGSRTSSRAYSSEDHTPPPRQVQSSSLRAMSSISIDYSDTVSLVSTAPSTVNSVSTAPSTVNSVIGDFFVFCLQDYEPTDTDQLGFRKGDILAILRTEDNEWWGATQGGTVGWIPSSYVEPISDTLADTMCGTRRELRSLPTTDNYETDTSGPNGNRASLSTSSQRASAEASLQNDTHVQRRGFGTSSRTYSSGDHTPPPRQVQFLSPRPIRISNGTGGFYTNYRIHAPSSSTGSWQVVGSPGQASARSGRSEHLSQDFPLPSPPGGRPAGLSSSWRTSKDEDSLAYRNARIAADALPPHLKPEYGEDYLRLDSDGVVKSGTLEALVERLTVDPLRRSQENAYRTTFLMTYKTFTDGTELFGLLVERYLMDPPPGLTDDQRAEWKEKRLRPTQTRVLNTFREWVERYRFVKDESHLVEELKDFLGRIDQPASNSLSAKQLLETIGRQEAAIQAIQQQQAVTMAVGSSGVVSPLLTTLKRSLKLPLGGPSSNSKPHNNALLKLDPGEVARHLTLVEYQLYAKIRPSECMAWSRIQQGPEVENLAWFISTNDRLVAWVKYSILKEDTLGKRADMIDFWIEVTEKCRQLNNISSVFALVAGLASTVIVKLALTWANVSRGSHMQPLTRLSDPSNNFAAYRTFYSSVDTSCVPYIGMYLTQLQSYADQYKELVLVHKLVPTSGDSAIGMSSSPGSMSSLPSLSSSPMTNTWAHRYRNVETVTHINFTRLFKCAEAIHQILRHQSKGYRQANPSASAPHLVSDPSQAAGINLGVENAAVLAHVETMLATGGVGTNPPAGLPLVNVAGGDSNERPSIPMPVGVVEAWYWQRSSEHQGTEAHTSKIRKGLEAAGF